MARAAAAAETKEVSGFSLTEAHALAFRVARVPRSRVKWPWWKRLEGLSLVRFLLHHLDLALQWQASLPVALLVLLERQKGKKKFSCLTVDFGPKLLPDPNPSVG